MKKNKKVFRKSKLNVNWIDYGKNYFNLAKIIVLRLLKMVGNQTQCSSLEQKYDIRFFSAGKYKQWETCRRMSVVCGGACFCEKVLTNKQDIALPLWTKVEKTVNGVETHWISRKERVPGAVVSKEGDFESLLGNWKTHLGWSPRK